jgi:type VI protein secretion system component Hcp
MDQVKKSVQSRKKKDVQGPAAKFKDFSFSIDKQFDKMSPHLFKAYCQTAVLKSEPFSKAVVTMRKAGSRKGGLKYLTITFTEVYVTNYTMQLGSGDVDGHPDETVTFCFGAFQLEYFAQTDAGDLEKSAITCGFDFRNLQG